MKSEHVCLVFFLFFVSAFTLPDRSGAGSAFSIDAEYRLYKGFGMIADICMKDKGYLVGKDVEKSTTVLAGVRYGF